MVWPGIRQLGVAGRGCNGTKGFYDRLQKSGVGNLYCIPSEHLSGDDGEGTVDGSHPAAPGFMR